MSSAKRPRPTRGFKAEIFGLENFDLEVAALQVYVKHLGSVPREQCTNHLSALLIITLTLMGHLAGSDEADARMQQIVQMWGDRYTSVGDSETLQ